MPTVINGFYLPPVADRARITALAKDILAEETAKKTPKKVRTPRVKRACTLSVHTGACVYCGTPLADWTAECVDRPGSSWTSQAPAYFPTAVA